MRALHDYFDTSLRRRITLSMMLTVLTVLALATSAFLINDAVSARRVISEELSTLAQVVGAICIAAMSFIVRHNSDDFIS